MFFRISKENDERNIEELFGDLKFDNKKKDKKIDSLVLTDENTHIQFGRMIGKILNRSGVKSHVVEFAKELLNTLSLNLTSKEYQVLIL